MATLPDAHRLLPLPAFVPVAESAWQVDLPLLNTVQESAAAGFDVPGPVMLHGLHISLSRTTFGALLVPTLDDVEISVEVEDVSPTLLGAKRQEGATVARDFVVASAWDIRLRLLQRQIAGTRPRFGFRARWRALLPGPAAYESVQIAVVALTSVVKP
jgi:hypothetical protein